MKTSRCVLVLLIALWLIGIPILIDPPGFAAADGPWFVALGGDDGQDCLTPDSACASINGALAKATSGDTVFVGVGTFVGTDSQVVLIDKGITLSGGWNPDFSAQIGSSTIDGEDTRRGVTVNVDLTASLDHLDIQNGFVACCNLYGGGIRNDGTLTLTAVTVAGNNAWGGGGGIYNTGTLGLSSCTLSGNAALGYLSEGGGLWNRGGVATIADCVVEDNTAGDEGGGGGGGLDNFYGTMTVSTSTIHGNEAYGGSGISNSGTLTVTDTVIHANTGNQGAGMSNGGILTINSSTVSGNTASWAGGGIHNGGLGDIHLNSSTVAYNTAASLGGGIRNAVGTIEMQNSILAQNSAATGPNCMYATITSAGYNLLGSLSDCAFTPGAGDLIDVDPLLYPLDDNGGPTLTHALQVSSQAINAGNPAGCTDHLGTPLLTDQRGMPRVGVCDMGSYEFQQGISSLFLPLVLRNYCAALYHDDFSDPGSGWPILDTGNTAYEYLSGEYRILLRSTDWWAAASPGFSATDYISEVDVRNAASSYGTYGLLFGLSADWEEFYEFEIGADGYFGVYKYNHGAWTGLASGSSGSIIGGAASNRLKILREGTTIEAYANGTLLTTIADGSFTGSRRLGVIAFSYGDPNVDVRYDNFIVQPVTCAGVGGSTQPGDMPTEGGTMDGTLEAWEEGSNAGR